MPKDTANLDEMERRILQVLKDPPTPSSLKLIVKLKETLKIVLQNQQEILTEFDQKLVRQR